MKARTKAAKRRHRVGRKLKPGAVRTPSGQISRSNAVKDGELASATWRRRMDNPGITSNFDACQAKFGSVIDKWQAEGKLSELQYRAAVRFHEVYERWLSAIEAKRVQSGSDLNRVSGSSGGNPFDDAQERRHRKAETDFKAARSAILLSGPLSMMAIEAVVVENQPASGMMGDLRTALNALAVLWGLKAAA